MKSGQGSMALQGASPIIDRAVLVEVHVRRASNAVARGHEPEPRNEECSMTRPVPDPSVNTGDLHLVTYFMRGIRFEF